MCLAAEWEGQCLGGGAAITPTYTLPMSDLAVKHESAVLHGSCQGSGHLSVKYSGELKRVPKYYIIINKYS